MRIYRFAWVGSATVVIASCLVHDVASGGLWRMVGLSPVMALFGGILGLVLTEERPDSWTWARRGVVWAGLGTVAADALLVTWGAAGALVGVVLLLTSPALLRTGRSQFLAWSTRRTAGPPEALATRDLLRLWDWTTGELQRTGTSMERRLVLVEERRTLLDELQRRDPTHFDDWMAAAMSDQTPGRMRGGGERP